MRTSYNGPGDLHEVEFAISLYRNIWQELSQWQSCGVESFSKANYALFGN